MQYVFIKFKVLIEMKVSQSDETKTSTYKWVNLILQVCKSSQDKNILFTKEIIELWFQWTCQEFTKFYAIYNGTSVIYCHLGHFSYCFTITNSFLQKIFQYCLQRLGYYIQICGWKFIVWCKILHLFFIFCYSWFPQYCLMEKT